MKVTYFYKRVAEGSTNFGFRDKKNRAVGYRWTIDEVTLTPFSDDDKSGYYDVPDDAPLTHFQLITSPTRDGHGYGPSFNRAEASTLVEAEAIVSKRTEAARKRDFKKFAGGES